VVPAPPKFAAFASTFLTAALLTPDADLPTPPPVTGDRRLRAGQHPQLTDSCASWPEETMVLGDAGPAALMVARVFITFLLCPMVLGIAVLLTLQTLIHWSVARRISEEAGL
jgi:hypothetical protein